MAILADLNIICIGQARKKLPPDHDKYDITPMSRNRAKLRPVYWQDDFPVAHSLRGWWYCIYPKGWEEFLENPFFEFNSGDISLVKARSQWVEDIRQLLAFYIGQSPAGEIGVVIRLQSAVSECVHERCCLSAFVNDLIAGNIAYNHLYFITA